MSENNIPRIRANKATIDRIFGMYAGLQELEQAANEMEKRFRAIPNGWRDLKLCIKVLNKLLDGVIATVPPEKFVAMKRMLPRMHFKLVCGPQASEAGSDECIISVQEANVLSHYAHEYCKMCFENNCNNCLLGKTLDSVMTYDRDGSSWASVSLAKMQEECE